jgi:citrate synthase
VSELGASDRGQQYSAHPAIHNGALRLFAVLPSIVAADQRRRHGLGAITPRPDLGYAENFLHMTFGKVPEPQVAAAFETSLILYADPSFNSPSFTAPAGIRTLSDLSDAIIATIGTLKGPPNADGPEAVLEMMNEVAIPDNARPWVEEALAGDREISGFGHCPDKTGDVRVPAMHTALGMIASLRRGHHLVEIYEALATAMFEVQGLRPNLDYPAAPAFHLIGFDALAFSSILAVARLPGWAAHIA